MHLLRLQPMERCTFCCALPWRCLCEAQCVRHRNSRSKLAKARRPRYPAEACPTPHNTGPRSHCSSSVWQVLTLSCGAQWCMWTYCCESKLPSCAACAVVRGVVFCGHSYSLQTYMHTYLHPHIRTYILHVQQSILHQVGRARVIVQHFVPHIRPHTPPQPYPHTPVHTNTQAHSTRHLAKNNPAPHKYRNLEYVCSIEAI